MPRKANTPRGTDPTIRQLALEVSELKIEVAALRKNQQERERSDDALIERLKRLAYMVERKLGPIGVEELGL